MTAGAPYFSNVILEKSYDPNSPLPAITESVKWAEHELKEPKGGLTSTCPWRKFRSRIDLNVSSREIAMGIELPLPPDFGPSKRLLTATDIKNALPLESRLCVILSVQKQMSLQVPAHIMPGIDGSPGRTGA